MTSKKKTIEVSLPLAAVQREGFAEVVAMIQAARGRALADVNSELVDLYWRVGAYISRKLEIAAWGENVVEVLSRCIADRHLGLRGFARANLFRIWQFYDTYRGNEKVATLLRQLPWSSNRHVLAKGKRPEEREFSALTEFALPLEAAPR